MERGLARQEAGHAILRLGRQAAAHDGVVAQPLGVEHVGQAEHDAVHGQAQERCQAVHGVGGAPGIQEPGDHPGQEGRALLELPQEHQASEGREGVIPDFYAQRPAERGTFTHEAHALALLGLPSTASGSANRAPYFVLGSAPRGRSGISPSRRAATVP